MSGAPHVDWSMLIESVPSFGEDCLDVFQCGDAFTVVLGDGAGGMGGGGAAADLLMWRARAAAEGGGLDLDGWQALFTKVDREIAKSETGGECTGIVLVISPRGVMGVSAGDSEAWIVTSNGIDDLTAKQSGKRLGSGRARPVSFERPSLAGTVIVGTDRLFRCASAQKIAEAVRGREPDEAAEWLRALERLKSGRDHDVAVVVVALPRRHAGRRRGAPMTKKPSSREQRWLNFAVEALAAKADPNEIRRTLREAGATAHRARRNVNLAREVIKLRALLGRFGGL